MAGDVGLRAHRVTVVALLFAASVVAVTLTMRPGASLVVWPLAYWNGRLLMAALAGGLVAIVSSSTAAHRGYPAWSGVGALVVVAVFFCTGCTGLAHFGTMGSFEAGGTRVGNVTWRNAHAAVESYTVSVLYRCDRFGLVCTPCADTPPSRAVVWGAAHPAPDGETCPVSAETDP